MDKLNDKFRGCMIGGAAGDALGYAVEFMPEQQIFSKYGKNGITSYSLVNDKALISDDTQMSLFTAAGLLLGSTRARERGIFGGYSVYIAKCYEEWLETQEASAGKHECLTWLMRIPELHSRRAPGNTCITSIKKGCNGNLEKPINHSKGCGGVMRAAPVGLYLARQGLPQDQIDLIGAQSAALTHGHELGYISAAALVHIISLLTKNEDMSIKEAAADSVAAMKKMFPDSEHIAEFTDIMTRTLKLAENETDDLAAIHSLGEGWVAEETLAIAVYCAVKYSEDFEKCIAAAVNHKGDSDSTGAVAGNIVGTYLGYEKIPAKFKEKLEIADVILEIADDLYLDNRMCPDRADKQVKCAEIRLSKEVPQCGLP